MITVNPKKNQKMLMTFNNDPYFDLKIKTKICTLYLVQSYLAIDSQFFDGLSTDTIEVDLCHLPADALIRVLRSLYGEELKAVSIKDLHQLSVVIDYLGINEYKHNIISELAHRPELFNNLDLIQFCFRYCVLKEQIKRHHFGTKLAALADPRNYLQLESLSSTTLNQLLTEYRRVTGEFADHTVTRILQSYFDRNQIKAQEYFQLGCPPALRFMWERYHHSTAYIQVVSESFKQILMAEVAPKNAVESRANKLMKEEPKKAKNGQNKKKPYTSTEMQEKDTRLVELLREVHEKQRILKIMKQEIAKVQRQRRRGNNVSKKSFTVDSQENSVSLLENMREKVRIPLTVDFDCSFIEPAFNKISNPRQKQARKIRGSQFRGRIFG